VLLRRSALVIAVALLGATALLKAISVMLPPPAPAGLALVQPNFVFPQFTERTVLLISIAWELAFVLLLLSSTSNYVKFVALAWLSAVFAVYHYMTFFLGGQPCHCVGIWRNMVLSSPRITLSAALLLFISGCVGLVSTIAERTMSWAFETDGT
jgi:hypothetical protein